MLQIPGEDGWRRHLRRRRVRHFNRADAEQRPSDPSVSDGNQGFVKCVAAQRLRGLAARQRQRHQSHPADASDSSEFTSLIMDGIEDSYEQITTKRCRADPDTDI